MSGQIIINLSRPGKGVQRFVEDLVTVDPSRIRTYTHLPPEIRRKLSASTWQNGFISHGTFIIAVKKYLFPRQWFSVMHFMGEKDAHLGYYIDIVTPLRRVGGDVFLTDLFLDIWIAPDGNFLELDWDVFEKAYHSGTINYYRYRRARQVFNHLKLSILNKDFFDLVAD